MNTRSPVDRTATLRKLLAIGCAVIAILFLTRAPSPQLVFHAIGDLVRLRKTTLLPAFITRHGSAGCCCREHDEVVGLIAPSVLGMKTTELD
jgi:hypothetical protein